MVDLRFKLAVLGASALAVGYLAYPYWDPPSPQTESETKPPVLEARWLAKPAESVAGRDPFALPESRRPPRPPAAVAQPRDRAPGPGGGAAAASTARPTPPPELSLGAVLIDGDRRAAILNGRVYRPGESLRLDGPDRGRWRLDRVAPDGVVVAETSGPRSLRVGFRRARVTGRGVRADRTTATEAAQPGPEGPGHAILERLGIASGGDVGAAYGKLWELFLGSASGSRDAPAESRTGSGPAAAAPAP